MCVRDQPHGVQIADFNLGRFYFVYLGTLPPSSCWNTFPLSTNCLHHSSHPPHLHQISQYFHDCCTTRWHHRLDARWQIITGLDGPNACYQAGHKHQDGMHLAYAGGRQLIRAVTRTLGVFDSDWTRSPRFGRTGLDLGGAIAARRILYCPSEVCLFAIPSFSGLRLFSHVVGYSMNRSLPMPYRLKSSSLRLQIPDVSAYIPESRFMKTVRESAIWQMIGKTFFAMRTWTRATIFGDRVMCVQSTL